MVCNTSQRSSSCFITVAMLPLFSSFIFTSSGKVRRSRCRGESVNPSLITSVYSRKYVHLNRIGFTWLEKSVCSLPGHVFMFVQPIRPGHPCYGLVERGFVTYLGWRNPSFVQRSPELLPENIYPPVDVLLSGFGQAGCANLVDTNM